ncbi:MAG: NAD(P)H-dependent glycerol-3-phosphate dehydrogenase [Pseudomonadota bacterium]
MTSAFGSIGVVGAGAWGAALACAIARAGGRPILWARSAADARRIQADRENPRRLPGVRLPGAVEATADLGVCAGAEALLIAVPAQTNRAMFERLASMAGMAARPVPVALSAKGLEAETGAFLSDILADVWPNARPAILSGPSFAADVAAGLPTAVTLACPDEALGRRWAESLKSPDFRPYLSTDLIGAQLGGAMKNVLAIACGVVEGRGLGESARAALIARGFAEMSRLAQSIGAAPETLGGLSGLGDLALTCSSQKSRNMRFGALIGGGRAPSDAAVEVGVVVEGAATATALLKRAQRAGVDTPITEVVVEILHANLDVDTALGRLMTRPLRSEFA